MDQKRDKESILIVDDDKTSLQVLKGVLEKEYRVITAQRGYDAMALALSENQPELIMLDVMLPDMNGYDVCRILKANALTRETPVIFITARDDRSAEAEGLEAGAVDYITKPFCLPVLKSRIRSHMELVRYRIYLEEQVEKRTEELLSAQRNIIERLAHAAEYRDNETGTHIKRLSLYVKTLAHQRGFPESYCRDVLYASSMHDVGKIGIPDKILLKPAPLDGEEWVIMKRHTTIGADLLQGGESPLLKMAEVIALTHHERWDGKGYPAGLSGDDIPVEGRLTAICDVFDALTTWRPYKKPWTMDKAVDYINSEEGKAFDPVVVRLFRESLHEFRRIFHDLGDDGDV